MLAPLLLRGHTATTYSNVAAQADVVLNGFARPRDHALNATGILWVSNAQSSEGDLSMQRTFRGHILLPLVLAAILSGCGDGVNDGENDNTPPPPPISYTYTSAQPRHARHVEHRYKTRWNAGPESSRAGPGGAQAVTADKALRLVAGNYTVEVVNGSSIQAHYRSASSQAVGYTLTTPVQQPRPSLSI